MMLVHHRDGATNKALVFTTTTAKITIILTRHGHRAIIYKKFANNLKTAGFNVIATDWRGSGHSAEGQVEKSTSATAALMACLYISFYLIGFRLK